MKGLFSIITLALMTALSAKGEGVDSLQIYVQAGDSCMQQYDTYEALKCYQRAYAIAESQDSVRISMEGDIRVKLADCYYKRADAFRQLAYSYQKQGDNDSFMYWAQQLVGRFPMDGEVVAGLTLAYAKANQPQRGIICGMKYCQRDSTNILVNRALADAWFMNRDFTAAGKLYDRLLEQGDSTFNTLYSAGMCCSQLDSLERAYKYLQLAFLISGMQHAGCAYRLGVVCVDTQRYPEGLNYLSLARELMRPDTTIMKAITLSQGEGYYLTQHYPEAVNAWKEHLSYNPSSVATYFNIANAYAYIPHAPTLRDGRQSPRDDKVIILKCTQSVPNCCIV